MDIKFDFEKEIQTSIREIKSFSSEKGYKIIDEKKKLDTLSVVENKSEEDLFRCQIFLDNPIIGLDELKSKVFNANEQLTLLRIGQIYTISSADIITASCSFEVPQIYKLTLKKFYSGDIDEYDNKFHRLIIPIEKEFSFEIFDSKRLKIGSKNTFGGLVEINFQNNQFHIFKHENNDLKEKFIIIEGQNKSLFSDFQSSCESIITAIGFLTGSLIQNKNFYLTSKDLNFKIIENVFFERKNPNVFRKNYIINPSDFKYYIKNIGVEEKYKNYCTPISTEIFSQLVFTIKTNSVYARCCKLVIEAELIKNQHVLKAGVLSIALETLTTLISDNNKDNIKVITNKEIEKSLKKELLSVLEKYKSQDISEESLKILTSKINEINRPTNSKKLSYPFDLYNIKLNTLDKEILNHRNKFLHGTSPFDENELQEKETDLLLIIGHLTFMVDSLILKYIGYHGHIAFSPSFIQRRKKIEVSDYFFKII